MLKNYDVIIAGCGASGLYAALNLAPELNVLLIAKRNWDLCNSALAQGGIAAVYDSPGDSVEFHENDTFIAGGFKNSKEAVEILVNEAAYDLQRMLDIGVDFDRKPDGSLHRTLEGGHSKNRIFHHKDQTGLELITKLYRVVRERKNIDVAENALLCDVKKTSTGYSALIMRDDEYCSYNSHYFIMATGGIGRVYQFTTNTSVSTGDGISFAYEMGAEIKNLSWIQFHPTAFNGGNSRERFLISEALRGEGAYLLNEKGERFMKNYDDRLELAPRDVVSHSMILESRKQNSDSFYIDISYKDADFIKDRFPTIYKNVREQGYDLTSERVPIFPCQHYLMGGIGVDGNAETTLPGLYAVGECSNTGVHGNNRLASNSLLEALVFSRRAAADIGKKANGSVNDFEEYRFEIPKDAVPIPHGIRTEVREIMQKSYFVIPDKDAIAEGFGRVRELKQLLSDGNFIPDYNYVEARAVTTSAYLILKEVL